MIRPFVVYANVGALFGHKQAPKAMSMESSFKSYIYEMMELFTEFRVASIENEQVIHNFGYIGDVKRVQFNQTRNLSFLTALKNEVEVHFQSVLELLI